MAPFSMRARLQNIGITRKSLKLRAKKKKNGIMQERFKRLKMEMEEISEEQKNVREGQRQVHQKIEAIESDCEKLKMETKMMIRQSAITQIKLALMFRILKAKEEGDFGTAANLCQLLRQIIQGRDS